jgi:hypothetical protein
VLTVVGGIPAWVAPVAGGTVTSVSGTALQIDVATGTTTPVISIDTGYVGQASITTLGTVTTGTWNATTIAIAKGGTGQVTAAAAYNALSPMTTTGDIEYEVSAGVAGRLAIGTTGQILTVVAGLPAWAADTFGGFANPTGLIGLAVVNGVATTATRSDATHAIDQTILPTWTRQHIFATSVSEVACVVKGFSGNYSHTITGFNGAGLSFGAQYNAGTNSSDVALTVQNAAASVAYFNVRGDGKIQGGGPVAAALVDMTPDASSFTGTLTGCTTAPTGSFFWSRNGNQVTITNSGVNGISNSTAATITGLPAALQPTRTQIVAVNLEDNGNNVTGLIQIVAASGTMTLFRGVVAGTQLVNSTTGFTGSGTKGLSQTTFSYLLN